MADSEYCSCENGFSHLEPAFPEPVAPNQSYVIPRGWMNQVAEQGVGSVPAIPVSRPDLSDRERAYLMAAYDSTWISSKGPFVEEFERRFGEFVGAEHAISCVNGTAALHLALLGLGIGPGDEVVVPDLTYVATANAVRYVGAEPVLADCDPRTWTLDPSSLQRLVTKRTRAVIAVHLHGFPCDMGRIAEIAEGAGVCVIEDAAEAHGARFLGRPVGSWGDVATFSFYGNKIITTGEGGMVCTSCEALADRVRRLRGQGVDPTVEYWFDRVGYNYRMTNPSCAVGLGQLERFEEFRGKRAAVKGWYDESVADAGLPVRCQCAVVDSEPVLWMYGVCVGEEAGASRDALRRGLAAAGIETRPFFYPLHHLPMYQDCRTDAGCPVTCSVAGRGVMLPTHTGLSRADVRRVVAAACEAMHAGAGAP